MNTNKKLAEKQIENLVHKFKMSEATYLQKSYKEAEVRLHFIDQFFKILGWDVDNSFTDKERGMEVIIEKSIENKKQVNFIDYVFLINQKTQFLVEAKKPSESLNNKRHIFQAKSYAFSTGIPFVILTNFKEFRLFDISTKPLLNQPDTDLVEGFDLSYLDYTEKFELIWNTFSREAVENKSLAKLFLQRRKSKINLEKVSLNYASIKGNSLLDKAFLADLLEWRKLLATNIHQHNSEITIAEINEIVQRHLDRFIFLRILEDREIESKEHLRESVVKFDKQEVNSLNHHLIQLYQQLNKKYNGLLFHPHSLIDEIKVDDAILAKIIKKLYYPHSPYNFKEIQIEILGRIFEQYLCHTIIVQQSEIQIIPKPFLKKSNSIYYTPIDIAERIVAESLGSLTDVQNIEEVEKLKIADVACGSGTFLIAVYRYLIKYFVEYYQKTPLIQKKALLNKDIFIDSQSNVRLSLERKKKILLDNIYGLDIDYQAVEVSQMSLYIVMLENSNMQTTSIPVLPDLQSNIRCGNAIISSSYLVDYEMDTSINPFDWRSGFSKIMKNGGFDCIVGNPPYLRIQILEQTHSEYYKKYITDKYISANYGNFDIYLVFIERSLKLLRKNGSLGYIIPNKLFTSKYGEGLRRLIASKGYIQKIVDFKDIQIFEDATTYTCLIYLTKKKNLQFQYIEVEKFEDWQLGKPQPQLTQKHSSISGSSWYFTNNKVTDLEEKLANRCEPLKNICDRVFVGLQTDCDEVFLIKELDLSEVPLPKRVANEKNIVYCYSKYTNDIHPFEKQHLKKVLKGSADIVRYRIKNKNRRLIFPYKLGTNRPPLISPQEYAKDFPLTWSYLQICEVRLKQRKSASVANGKWYGYVYKKNHVRFEQEKILMPSLCVGSRFYWDAQNWHYFVGSGIGGGGGYGIILAHNSPYTYPSLLGILNSHVISFFILQKASSFRGGYKGIDKKFLDSLLLPNITSHNELKIKTLEAIGKNVKTLLQLYHQSPRTQANQTKKQLLVRTFNDKINQLVYKLYDLNEEEIQLMEDFMAE